MSAISAVTVEEMSSKIEPTLKTMPVKTQPKEKTMPVKTSLKKYRQKLMTIKARMRYREQTIKGFRPHLKNGTIPERLKSLLPCPKMASPESQVIVNAACDQVQSVILDQMMQEEEKKLSQDQDSYQTMKDQREGTRQKFKTPKKHKKPTVAQLQQELADLQSKYTQLCSKLETVS